MFPLCFARRPASLAAGMGLVLLVALASLPVVSRLRMPPVVRTVAVGRVPTAVVVDARTRRVFVTTGEDYLFPTATPGWVQMLDSRTGRRLRPVAVGLGPAALAVDGRSGHVFVANIYGRQAGPGSLGRLVVWGRPWLPALGQQWVSGFAQAPSPRSPQLAP